MKPNFIGKLFACVTALAFVSFTADVHAQAMKQGSAKVRNIKGSAQYSAEMGAWVPLKVGTTLHAGASIKTAAESTVDLDLEENGPVLRIAPNSTVSLDKLLKSGTGMDSVTETKINVQNGTVIGNVKKLARASKYEIKTPNGVAGIRGTDYVVSVRKLSDGTFEVTFTDITGTLVVVAMVNGKPETVVLNAGESWTPGSNVKPTPRQLLEFYRAQVASAINNTQGGGNAVAAAPSPEQVIEPRLSPTIGGPFQPGGGGGVILPPPGDG